MRLDGKMVIITGAANGLGKDNARLFSEEGAKVAIADIDEANGKRVAEEINSSGGQAIYLRMDVTREEDWERTVKDTVKSFGRVDILVNNAGIFLPLPGLERTTLAQWEKLNNTHARAIFLGMRAVIPEMLRIGKGSIVNIVSPSAYVGGDSVAAYHASKGAIRSMSKAVAIEYASKNIKVNCLYPGPFEVGIIANAGYTDSHISTHKESIPMGRYGLPREESYGVLFLASDESSYMTGADLPIEGGRIIRGGSLRGMA